ncbi:MAG TPA: lysylphosphatidylglycerol synthase transmembrane domain-containing protein [Bacteroidota bacterium]|nr:lysylphosphatidylglycerol synthase transmembrane domain-containing protein [Bacteroidota bacterium]
MNRRFTLVLMVIGLGVLASMVMHLGVGAILANVDKVKWWFVPIVGIWGIVYACNAWAIYILIGQKHEGLTFVSVLLATVSSFAINYITPFLNLGGEPYRAAVLKPIIGGHRAVSAVVSYNIVRMMGHCVFWLCAGVIAIVWVPMSPTALLLLSILLFGILGLFLAFAMMQKHGFLERIWMRFARFFSVGKRRTWFEAKAMALHDIDARMKIIYSENPKAFKKAIAVETVSRLIATFEFVFIMEGIWGHPSYRDALLLNGASSLVLNMLFFIPFELGTREGSLILTLHLIGYQAELGIFIGLINRARELVWILIGLALMPFGPERAGGAKRISLREVEEHS